MSESLKRNAIYLHWRRAMTDMFAGFSFAFIVTSDACAIAAGYRADTPPPIAINDNARWLK